MDDFQFAYKAGHSCGTALLRVCNDIVTTIGKGNGSFPVFFYLLPLTQLIVILCLSCWRSMSESPVMHYS